MHLEKTLHTSPDGANPPKKLHTSVYPPRVLEGSSCSVPAEPCRLHGPGTCHLDNDISKMCEKSMLRFYQDIWKGESQRPPLLAEIWMSKGQCQKTSIFIDSIKLLCSGWLEFMGQSSDWNFWVKLHYTLNLKTFNVEAVGKEGGREEGGKD